MGRDSFSRVRGEDEQHLLPLAGEVGDDAPFVDDKIPLPPLAGEVGRGARGPRRVALRG